jgi:hypothetical protein
MHVADPAQLPGKKLWTYGHGKHRAWGQATTEGGLSYAEIESGPLLDQSEKPLFPPGAERRYEEFWIPVNSRDAFEHFTMPKLELPPLGEPWLGWTHSAWQMEWENFRAGIAELPSSPLPTGLELELPLRRELERGNANAAEPLALWLAFHNRPNEALPLVEVNPAPGAQRIAGLVQWKAMDQPQKAVAHLEAGPLSEPVAIMELDELYADLKLTEKRIALLARAPTHRMLIERRADLALALGHPAETLRLLEQTDWPREHQRYVRTELWKRAKAALGQPEAEIPMSLNEDNLARFGAYWSD